MDPGSHHAILEVAATVEVVNHHIYMLAVAIALYGSDLYSRLTHVLTMTNAHWHVRLKNVTDVIPRSYPRNVQEAENVDL